MVSGAHWRRTYALSSSKGDGGLTRRMSKALTSSLAIALTFAWPFWFEQAWSADFYSGKTITFSTHGGVGGSYDTYLRLLARHIGGHIQGHPNVEVFNQPGAGGLLAVNYAGQTAPKDGTFLTLVDQGIPLYEVTGQPGLHVSLKNFEWIGNLSTSNNISVAWYKSGIESMEDATKRIVTMAASGAGSPSASMPLLYNYMFETRFKAILGYGGAPQMVLAMERGEVDGRSIDTWDGYKASFPNDVRERHFNILVQIGLKKAAGLTNVPLLTDLAAGHPTKAAIAKFVTFALTATRPIAAVPGTPPARVKELREAFDATVKDPAFLADAERTKAEISSMSGEHVQSVMDQLYSTPPDIVRLYLKITTTPH